ncbi:MAG: hypothetical protein ACOX87_02165 [Chloroflexota bacterium]
MRLGEIARLLKAEPLSPRYDPNLEVTSAFGADLMSDVLSFARPGVLLLTGLTTPQVIRTAEVAGVVAVVLVRGKKALPETERLGVEAGIPILRTSLIMFDACGRLYEAGLRGYSNQQS